jgi:chromosome segregation ATPase
MPPITIKWYEDTLKSLSRELKSLKNLNVKNWRPTYRSTRSNTYDQMKILIWQQKKDIMNLKTKLLAANTLNVSGLDDKITELEENANVLKDDLQKVQKQLIEEKKKKKEYKNAYVHLLKDMEQMESKLNEYRVLLKSATNECDQLKNEKSSFIQQYCLEQQQINIAARVAIEATQGKISF